MAVAKIKASVEMAAREGSGASGKPCPGDSFCEADLCCGYLVHTEDDTAKLVAWMG